MNETVNSVDVILASPEATPFKKPPNNIKALYRAIVPKDRDINSIKSNGKIVAFATDINGAHEFMRSIDAMQRYVIIKKEFRPQDFVLDYTSFYETHDPDSQGSRYISEHEVWMKNTPYYTSAKKDEIVFDSDKDENLAEAGDKKAAVLKIQKHLNKKYGANLDLDGILGPLTLKSINKFMPQAKKGLADEPNKTTAVQGKKLKEASGYIPSEKEKNDPRFKTALTVDVKPDSIKKNAKAFSWLTSRAGIPPDARPDGKIK
jgi:hypothetical protein